MLLTPDHSRHSHKRERLWLHISILLIIGLLLALLWQPSTHIVTPLSDAVFCDTEQVKDDHLYNDSYEFSGIKYRSRERAYSGKYSISFPADNKTHYGFSTTIESVKGGEVYEVSVWSFGNETGTAHLVVQGRNPKGLYIESAKIIKTNNNKWSLHKIKISLPFKKSPTQLAVYVYSKGTNKVFFDDLLIKRIQLLENTPFQAEKLYLDIESNQWQKIINKRDEALKNGLLQSNEDDWIKAYLRDSENASPIKIKARLKGDWLDHLKGDKWSFRIKISSDRAWKGINTFSLHTPKARYFLHEWLLHQFWEKEDVLTTRYDFIELMINEESKGIYAYEEHFAKQLLESRHRREGPIVKFNEDGFWASYARQLENHGFISYNNQHSGQRLANAKIDAFQSTQIQADANLMSQFHQAQLLLSQFRNGDLPPEEVFDLKRMAIYYAGCDLFNAYHGIVWHNQRYYYNPIIGKLEPIGFDGFGSKPSARYHFLGEGALQPIALESESLFAYLLQDTKFVQLYIKALEKYSSPDYWDAFWSEKEADWTARLQWIQLEFPYYSPDPLDIKNEIDFIRSKLLPFSETSLRVFKDPKGGLKLENTHTLPIIIKGFGNNKNQPTKLLETPIWLPATPVRKLWTKLGQEDKLSQFSTIQFWDQAALSQQAIPYFKHLNIPSNTAFLFYQIPGWDSLFISDLKGIQTIGNKPITPIFRKASLAKDFPSIRWDKKNKTIFIPQGKYIFKQDLIISNDYRLNIAAGTEIDLQHNAAIISYGAIHAVGQEGRPIIIFSSDKSGQGLQVLNTKEQSLLKMVYFNHLRALSKGDWQLTGAVTFYESSVKIVNCRFLNNQSEDGLNIIRSTFDMEYTLFQNTSSDAFDCDFCKGNITSSTFNNSMNDGMDFSGSIITIKDCELLNCGDKAISVGEASDVTIVNTNIDKSLVGIAAKDQSLIYAKNLILSNCEQGILAFQKKPEYGPAKILIEGLISENIKYLYQIGAGSRLQIDDQIMK